MHVRNLNPHCNLAHFLPNGNRYLKTILDQFQTGFRLLNLKNDGLRKKFDSLKYDMKKVEEVVYDLSIRGLLKNDDKTPREITEKLEAVVIAE